MQAQFARHYPPPQYIEEAEPTSTSHPAPLGACPSTAFSSYSHTHTHTYTHSSEPQTQTQTQLQPPSSLLLSPPTQQQQQQQQIQSPPPLQQQQQQQQQIPYSPLSSVNPAQMQMPPAQIMYPPVQYPAVPSYTAHYPPAYGGMYAQPYQYQPQQEQQIQQQIPQQQQQHPYAYFTQQYVLPSYGQTYTYPVAPSAPAYQALPWVLENDASDKLTLHGDRLTVSIESRGSGYALGTLPLSAGRWSWSVKINDLHKTCEVVMGVVQKNPTLPTDYMASYSSYSWSSTGYVFSSAGPSDPCPRARCEVGDVLHFVLDIAQSSISMTNTRTNATVTQPLDKGTVDERGPFFPYIHMSSFNDAVSVSVFSS